MKIERLWEQFLIERLEFKNSILTIYFSKLNNSNSKRKWVFHDVKVFTQVTGNVVYYDEPLVRMGIDGFTRIFTKNKKDNELYILDGNYSRTVIKFNENKKW